ncbi:MAG: hypothetical protein E7017_01570 [Alphaproteobacteria bacterium]|nr:hypothetical protein [Alphaproteobacteria bacterium]
MDKIFEREFENLRDLVKNPDRVMSKIAEEYERIIPMLVKAEDMSEEELVRRARQIKPLVRVNSELRSLDAGEDDESSVLVYVKPSNVHQSYLYSFRPEEDIVCNDDGKPMIVEGLEEVARFICYHRYGGYHMFLRPGVDEVLQQIPEDISIDEISAFEIKFASDKVREIYSVAVDRHVSTVILYGIACGLPEVIKKQPVIVGHKVYPYE